MKKLLPRVLLINDKPLELNASKWFNEEESKLEVLTIDESGCEKINLFISTFDPDCIVTFDSTPEIHKELYELSYEWRKKWINFSKDETIENISNGAFNCATYNSLNSNGFDHYRNCEIPLVSLCTPTYNIGEKIKRTYISLKNQTYTNWEWVLLDDSTKPETMQIIKDLQKEDCRIRIYSMEEKSGGNIGEAKYFCNMMATGDFIIELDHDDYLTENAVEEVKNAFLLDEEIGFVYSDCAEVTEDLVSLKYPDGWAFGYGKYRDEIWNGIKLEAAVSPNINPKTIRHIVSCPNHLRAWRRTIYFKIGGHNRRLTIADDYELMVRFFLASKMCKIDKMLYLQFYHGSNSQDNNRSEIQRKVRTISVNYNEQIKKRFEELGAVDWAYEGNSQYPIFTESRFGEEEQYVNLKSN